MVTVLATQHKVRFFASPDLKRWQMLSDFGPAGATGGVWECPDLFPLPVDGNPNEIRWVLDVDINPGGVAGGSGGQYFVGSFDGTRFVNENPPSTTLWADYGKDFYATISFSDIPPTDGRRIWMAWISNWQYANDEPTVIWRGAQSVPRELALRRLPDGIRLVQRPVAELLALRDVSRAGCASPSRRRCPSPPRSNSRSSRGPWSEAGIRLSNQAGEEAIVGVTSRSARGVRRPPQVAPGCPFIATTPVVTPVPIRWRDGRVALRVLFDRSVVEVFANDGETVVTDRAVPDSSRSTASSLAVEPLQPVRRGCGRLALSPDRGSTARRASSTAARRRAGACP